MNKQCLIPVLVVLLSGSHVRADTHYVNASNASPVSPFTNWPTASTNIQMAINLATAGDEVQVTNGVYGILAPVTITNGITVTGVNGASNTVIDGQLFLVSTRCVEITHPNALMQGFTVRNGWSSGGPAGISISGGGTLLGCSVTNNTGRGGGGVYCGTNGIVRDCLIAWNSGNSSSGSEGGGLYCATGGRVEGCVIRNNSAHQGAGVFCLPGGLVSNSLICANFAIWSGAANSGHGGGFYLAGGGTVSHCVIASNGASYYGGGGVWCEGGGVLRNCLIAANGYGSSAGGGVYFNGGGYAESCTIVGNTGYNGAGVRGQSGGTLRNTIVYYNHRYDGPDDNFYQAGLLILATNCCSKPLLSGANNRTDDPLCIDVASGNYHLGPLSPCIDRGTNSDWMAGALDLDGRPRILGDIVDIGAYETPFSGDFTADSKEGVTPLTCVFTGVASGDIANVLFQWDFDNDGTWDASGMGLAVVTNTYNNIGYFAVSLAVSNNLGETATVTKPKFIHVAPTEVFVSAGGTHTPPFTNWATAAHDIQSAVNMAVNGTLVWVTNGTYATTATIVVAYGTIIQSVGGWSNTIVDANVQEWDSRNVFALKHAGAVLRGFTIMRGRTSNSAGGVAVAAGAGLYDCVITNCIGGPGGGVLVGTGGVVSNCLVVKNYAGWYNPGGGVYSSGGLVLDCTISNNYSEGGNPGGGGVYAVGGVVRNCVIFKNRSGCQGGGVWCSGARLEGCTIKGNIGGNYEGGGVWSSGGSMITGCTINDNFGQEGGGVYMQNGTLVGCTIGCNTGTSYRGGGVSQWGGSVVNCLITNNFASGAGGGVAVISGTVRNCLVMGNSIGGGVGGAGGGVNCEGTGTLESSTVVGNRADHGGGVASLATYSLTVRNCIIYNNTGDIGANVLAGKNSTFDNVCASPLLPGSGNLAQDPQFISVASGDVRLLPGSPCLDAGADQDWMTGALDLAGTDRIVNSRADIGAYEFKPAGLAGNVKADVTEGFAPRTVVFTACAAGTNTTGLYYAWDFNNDGTNEMEGFGLSTVSNLYTSIGSYSIGLTISNVAGEVSHIVKPAYLTLGPAVVYVRPAASHVYPYTNWVKAATNLQAGLDAGVNGTLVLVTNGTYRLASPLTLRKGETIRGVNGAASTFIEAAGSNRCVELRHAGAVMDGFTIRNGQAGAEGGGGVCLFGAGTLQNCTVISNSCPVEAGPNANGGGVACLWGGLVTNCLVTRNQAYYQGGGLYCFWDGTVVDTRITSNSTVNGGGGGVYCNSGGLFERCAISNNVSSEFGGGAKIDDNGTLSHCLIARNTAGNGGYSGGGVEMNWGGVVEGSVIRDNVSTARAGGIECNDGGLVLNCLIYSNRAESGGGGVSLFGDAVVQNCSIVGNTVNTLGGGVFFNGSGGFLRNSIIYFNNGGGGDLYSGYGSVPCDYCCINPDPGGTGNVTNNPGLVNWMAGNFRLATNSPCVDAGWEYQAPTNDFEKLARPLDGNADGTTGWDIGACELASALVDADNDGLTDADEGYTRHTGILTPDTDADQMSDGDEIAAGTDPLDARSFLGFQTPIIPPAGSGIVVSWMSATGKLYRLDRATNLVSGFNYNVNIHIPATPPMNTSTDTTATATGPYFYRVKVE